MSDLRLAAWTLDNIQEGLSWLGLQQIERLHPAACDSGSLYYNKCTKHNFIRVLTAIFKDLHIENSKNYKRW